LPAIVQWDDAHGIWLTSTDLPPSVTAWSAGYPMTAGVRGPGGLGVMFSPAAPLKKADLS